MTSDGPVPEHAYVEDGRAVVVREETRDHDPWFRLASQSDETVVQKLVLESEGDVFDVVAEESVRWIGDGNRNSALDQLGVPASERGDDSDE